MKKEMSFCTERCYQTMLFVFLGGLLSVLVAFSFVSYGFLSFSHWLPLITLGFSIFFLTVVLFRFLVLKNKEQSRELQKVKEQSSLYSKKIKEQQQTFDALVSERFVMDSSVLYLSYLPDRTIVMMSSAFKNFLGLEAPIRIQDVFAFSKGVPSNILEIFKGEHHYVNTSEIYFTKKDGQNITLSLQFIPFLHTRHGKITFVYAKDITRYKETQEEVAYIKQKEYDDRVARQKKQTARIIAAQEQERERVAKDLHDGIGQVLTGLKFTLESIDFSKFKGNLLEKMTHFKKVFSGLIKDVRAVTFDLTPPELTDHGVVSAIERMTKEIAKLSDKKIICKFESHTTKDVSLSALIEINLYRVTQEAVNNALKYADASYILVRIIFTDEMLSISIEDDGNGFELPAPKDDKRGMGLFFMKERIRYIDGRFYIDTQKGKGTRVLINVKMV